MRVVGQHIKHFRILDKVNGAGDAVYKALDTRQDVVRSIKILNASLAGDQEALERLGREAENLASLKHPNILALHGFHGEPARAQSADGRVENFIGLAAAFSLERFRRNNNLFYEDIYYRDFCPRINRFFFTASSNDHAFLPVFWSESVGDFEFMQKFCAAEQPVGVSCGTADADGGFAG